MLHSIASAPNPDPSMYLPRACKAEKQIWSPPGQSTQFSLMTLNFIIGYCPMKTINSLHVTCFHQLINPIILWFCWSNNVRVITCQSPRRITTDVIVQNIFNVLKVINILLANGFITGSSQYKLQYEFCICSGIFNSLERGSAESFFY